jgi:TonB-dependent SusC/RagA subfamily outer membrane receptor
VRIIAEKPKNLQTIKVESSRVSYGTPDDELIVTKQMESYLNPMEILKGRIAGVDITGSFPYYKISIRGAHSFHGSSIPLVLVDGFQTSFEDLISMPVYFIDRIDILKSGGATAMYGMQGANGVINIITRTADRVSEYMPVNYSVNIRISGYNAPRIFYSPQHLPNKESSFEPDFRSTIYWEPNINLNSNKKVIVNYYNSDNSSIIKVIAEGITSTGIPISGSAEYEVR